MLVHACIALVALAQPAAQPETRPESQASALILGTFTNDAVALIDRGEAIAGDARLSIIHEHYAYQFATPESRAAFLENPAKYEIQLGGACARMGALSGLGSTSIYRVHEGRLYIFASEQCRGTFERHPDRVLEKLSPDEAPTGTPEQAARGLELLDAAVEWLGGDEALNALGAVEYRTEEDVDSRGKSYRQIDRTVIGPDGEMRTDYTWNEQYWMQLTSDEGSYFVDHATGARPMHPQQHAAMTRKAARQIPTVLRARNEPGFVAIASGRREDSPGETVLTHINGVTTELIIDADTGRLAGMRLEEWGPDHLLGTVERRFTSYDKLNGFKLPATWESWVDGVHAEALDRSTPTPARVLGELPLGYFTSGTRPIVGG